VGKFYCRISGAQIKIKNVSGRIGKDAGEKGSVSGYGFSHIANARVARLFSR